METRSSLASEGGECDFVSAYLGRCVCTSRIVASLGDCPLRLAPPLPALSLSSHLCNSALLTAVSEHDRRHVWTRRRSGLAHTRPGCCPRRSCGCDHHDLEPDRRLVPQRHRSFRFRSSLQAEYVYPVQQIRCQSFADKRITGRYLNPLLATAPSPTEITLGGELKREGANKFGQQEGLHKEGALVWLAHVHGLSEQRMTELGLHQISVTSVWEAILNWISKEKKSDVNELKPWFNKWYDTIGARVLDLPSARLLALPCQLFDHAEGFARVTRYIVYNSIGRQVVAYGSCRLCWWVLPLLLHPEHP
jgi:hypothetical protein